LVFKWVTNEISPKLQQIKLYNSNILSRISSLIARDAGLLNKNFPARRTFVMPHVLAVQANC